MSGEPPAVSRPSPGTAAWSSSQCSSCAGSPCCTRLPLVRFRAESRADLNYARALLEHHELELGLCDNGSWVAYYCRPCRELDPRDSRCRVHGTPAQPDPCRGYSPHSCWYRRVFSAAGSPELIRLNGARLEQIVSRVRFDAGGQIYETPSWDDLLALAAAVPLDRPDRLLGAHLPAGPEAEPPGVGGPRVEHALDPCRCLLFPLPRVWNTSHLEFIRFRLGFPGVKIWAAEPAWFVCVEAPCRRLYAGGCSRDPACPARLPWRYSDPTGVASQAHPESLLAAGFVRLDRGAFAQLRAHLDGHWPSGSGTPDPFPGIQTLLRLPGPEALDPASSLGEHSPKEPESREPPPVPTARARA